MFLFDTSKANDFPAMEAEVNRLMQRAEGELLVCKKWDERKLAYPIRGRKRGCYVLTYFKATPEKISALERDAQLSEMIIRLLVMQAERLTPEQMQALTPVEAAAAERDAARRQVAQEALAQPPPGPERVQAEAQRAPPAGQSDAAEPRETTV